MYKIYVFNLLQQIESQSFFQKKPLEGKRRKQSIVNARKTFLHFIFRFCMRNDLPILLGTLFYQLRDEIKGRDSSRVKFISEGVND